MNLDSQAAETVLEKLIRALEVGAQVPLGGGPVAAVERALARDDEELPLDADEQARGHACVELVHAELVGDHLARLQLLRLPQSHIPIVRRNLQLHEKYSSCKFGAVAERFIVRKESECLLGSRM